MRFCDRGEPVKLCAQSRKAVRWCCPRPRGQGPELAQYRGHRCVVLYQLLDRWGKVWPRIEKVCEHPVVFAGMMPCQGRAESQAVDRQGCRRLLVTAKLTADSGKLVSQLLMDLLQLPAECYGSLVFASGHQEMISFRRGRMACTAIPIAGNAPIGTRAIS